MKGFQIRDSQGNDNGDGDDHDHDHNNSHRTHEKGF